MFWQRCLIFAIAAALFGACTKTSETASAKTATSSTQADGKRPGNEGPNIPYKCYKKEKRGECLPPSSWVKELCDDVHPDIALYMMRAGTPWQRLYLLANAKPFNASGGASLLGDMMHYGEEVLALRRLESSGEFQVGDDEYASGYLALRWNGSCVTLHDGEYSRKPPTSVKHSYIEWRRLGTRMRSALELDPTIFETYEARRKHCRGRIIGTVTKQCEQYDIKLIDEVVHYVRAGGDLPEPDRID